MREHYSTLHKYPDELSAYVDGNDRYDESSGDVESPTGWFGRAGRNILVHDSNGFVDRSRYDTVAAARQAYSTLEDEYNAWSHECESTCYVCGGPHCGCDCGLCSDCNSYHPAPGCKA